MSRIDDLLLHLQSSYPGAYYLTTRIPSDVDGELSEVIGWIEAANDSDRELAISGFSSLHFAMMEEFACRMAALAVRTRQPDLVRKGLTGLAISSHGLDPRDIVGPLSVIYDASQKLGMVAEQLFVTSNIGTAQYNITTVAFPSRRPRDRSMDASGYEEYTDDDGFGYRTFPLWERVAAEYRAKEGRDATGR